MRFNAHYPYPPHLIAPLLVRVLFARPMSLSALAQALIVRVNPPPRVGGIEHIPPREPFILIFNHHESERVDAWWGPLVLAANIARARPGDPREIHFLMAREWGYPRGWERQIKQPFTRWFFARLAKTLGLVPVPPILEAVSTRGEGVLPVRRVLALTSGEHPELIGLAPEGTTGPRAALRRPPSGVGIFLALLSHGQIPILPAAWYEDDTQTLVARFGACFLLASPAGEPDRRAQDALLASQAMKEIAKLLPPHLQGVYGGAPGRSITSNAMD